jgi:REP element-mobilizing transposase RayT
MARPERIVIQHAPHHVTQRGNRRQPIFFSDSIRDGLKVHLTFARNVTV